MVRRIAIEPLESRRLLAVTGSLSGFAYLDVHDFGTKDADEAGFAGLTVRLKGVGSQGNLSDVSGVGPVQTLVDGSYRFDGLATGTYQIQISPSSKLAVGGSKDIQVTLAAGQSATDYNFAILGAQTNQISLRMFMGSTDSLTQFLTTLHTNPSAPYSHAVEDTSGSSSFTATYTTGGPGVAIVPSNATLTSPDSPTLTSMTVTLQNPLDGSGEQLSANTTGTLLTSNFTNSVLTLSGVADVADYQTVLRTVKYRITSSPAQLGDRTLLIVVNDGTATSTAATSTISVVQGIGPSGYTIAADKGLISASLAASTGFTFSNAVVGTTYNYIVNSSGGGTAVTGSGSVTTATQHVTGINVTGLSNGTLTYRVTLTDGSNQTGAATTATATLDKISPAGYTIAANQATVNLPASTNTGFTFAGAEVGATYNYSVTSSGGGTAVTGSGTVTSTTQQVTGLNVSTLSDGVLTFSVTLTDPAGNLGLATTATATLNTVVPSGYSITADQVTINASQAASTGFTFVGATAGTTYNYTVTSSGGTGSVTGSGSVTSATQHVTGISVAGLPDGILTYSVKLTNAVGNPGAFKTATATLDKTLPGGYTIVAVPAALNVATSTAAGFKFTGAEVGDTYHYSISSSGGGTPITNSGSVTSATQSVTGIDISTLSSGNLTYSVTLTDAVGNVSLPVTTSGVLDRTAPAGYTIVANQATINIPASTNTGFTFAGAEVNATYNYSITSSGGGTTVTGSGAVTSPTQQVTGLNVSTLSDGVLTFSVTLTDPAGNLGLATTATATLNTVVPSGYSITADQVTINASQTASTGFTFVGATAGTTYNYTVTSSGGTGSVTGSGSVTSATQQVTGISVTGLPDGILTYSVKLTNAVGNPGAFKTATATLDKTLPGGYTIVAVPAALNVATSTAAGFRFTGAEVGDTYHYSISSSGGGTPITNSGSVTSTTQSVTGIDISALSSGNLTYSVTLTDAAGNVSLPVTTSGVLDRTAPAGYTIVANQALINLTASTNTGFTFAGAEVGATYNFSVTSSGGGTAVTGSGAVTAAAQQVTGVNVSTLADGTLTYSVTLTNVIGNLGLATTATATLDRTAPQGYAISPDLSVYGAGNFGRAGFTLSGAEVGTTYHYTITSNNGGTPVTGSGTVTSATQDVTAINLTPLLDGTLTFSVTLTNVAGNVGTAATATAGLNRVVPSGYSYTLDQTTFNATTGKHAGFTLGNALVGNKYIYIAISSVNHAALNVAGIVTSPTQHVDGLDITSFPDGQVNFYLSLQEPTSGNTGSQLKLNATLDTTAPSGYTIVAAPTNVNAASAVNTGFTFAGATVGTTYNYTVTSSGGAGSVTGSGPVTSATQNVTGVDVSTLPEGTLTYHVTLTNAIGNTGTAATSTVGLYKTTPSGYSITAKDTVITAATVHATGFTFAGAQVGTSYHYTITSTGGGTPITNSGTVTSPTQSVTGIDVSTLLDGALTYSVTLTDLGGNAGTAATAPATLDRNAPVGYSITANQPVVNKAGSATAGFTLIGAAAGSTYQYTATSSGGGVAVTGSGSVTSTPQIVSSVDVHLLGDGTLTYHVTVTQNGHIGAAVQTTATLDQTAPSGFSVTPDLSTINAVAISSTGFTLSGAEIGATYTYTISEAGVVPVVIGGGPIIGGLPITNSGIVTSATQNISGINLSALADGTANFSVTLTDTAGNTSSPIIVQAMVDRTVPTAISLSTSVAPADLSGVLVGLLQTVGPQSSASYTYSLVPGNGSADNAFFQPIPVGSNELRTAVPLSSTGQPSYSIRVRSMDLQGKFIDQQFQITVSGTDPVTPTVLLDGSSSGVTITTSQSAAGILVGTLATNAASGGLVASQTAYSLVSGTGSTNNSSFQIVNGELQTTGDLIAGTYSVRVRSSGTFLISDIVEIGGISGPFAYQISFDPTELPSINYAFVSANAGLISLASDLSGSWDPAVSKNREVSGGLEQPNYLGSYSSFWSSVTTGHPSATLKDVMGSSGVDLAAHTAWAVVDRSGEYAVGVEVFTEKVFTITVTE